MPVFRIHMRRRRTVEQTGVLEVEAPTLGDAYVQAAFDMPDAEVRERTDWHGSVNCTIDEICVEGSGGGEDDGDV